MSAANGSGGPRGRAPAGVGREERKAADADTDTPVSEFYSDDTKVSITAVLKSGKGMGGTGTAPSSEEGGDTGPGGGHRAWPSHRAHPGGTGKAQPPWRPPQPHPGAAKPESTAVVNITGAIPCSWVRWLQKGIWS